MMPPTMKVFTWRCTCGIRIKVLADLDTDAVTAKSIVKCPRCNDQQTVTASKVISVVQDYEAVRPKASSRPD